MIRLGDLVGAILNEMAVARVQAALFAAEMAADFREHELLRDLPIPVFAVDTADVTVPVAVARASSDLRATRPLTRRRDDVNELATEVSRALPDAEGLAEVFDVFEGHAEQWRDEVASTVAADLVNDDTEGLSVEAVSELFGREAQQGYLEHLIQQTRSVTRARLQETIKRGHPDLLRRTATQALRDELAPVTRDAPDVGVHLLVEPDELQKAEHITTLTLHLDEQGVSDMTMANAGEART